MRDLIEEFGHLGITMVVSGILVATFLFSFFIPHMKTHTEATLPSDNQSVQADYDALDSAISRPVPTITIANQSVSAGEVIKFNDLIGTGVIGAVNADGENISNYMSIVPADSECATYFDANANEFKNAPTGEYKFIVSAQDVSGSMSYGPGTSAMLKVIVL